MGSGTSTIDYDSLGLQYYNAALTSSCLLPNVGIDDSLLKFSGINSNRELQAYATDIQDKVPGFIKDLGSALGPMTMYPNAVGLGALMLSFIFELCKGGEGATSQQYSLLRRVFADEKASDVRDTMDEFLKQYEIHIKVYGRDQRRLVNSIVETVNGQRGSSGLSYQLTRLKNSLVRDGQMSSRGFNHWVNGAAFHVQMLIHAARLNAQIPCSDPTSHKHVDVDFVNRAVSVYQRELDVLLEEYKKYTTRTIRIHRGGYKSKSHGPRCRRCKPYTMCYITNDEVNRCSTRYRFDGTHSCSLSQALPQSFINHIFSQYGPITGLKTYFANIQNNLNYLINQHQSFTVPWASG